MRHHALRSVQALATDDDYLRTGTRAWLYDQRKDASVLRHSQRQRADRWLQAVLSQMSRIWGSYNPDADTLLSEEHARLTRDGRGRPDNFMCSDLGDVVQSRYAKITGAAGLPEDVKAVNRGVYAALSRDSHARLRIEPAALTIRPDGTVGITPRRVDEARKWRTLLRCLESSLEEAIGAVSYLLEAREQADAENLRKTAASASVPEPPLGYDPDLGLHLAQAGGGRTTFHFVDVPISRLGVLPNGMVSWSASRTFGDRQYIATFDVPNVLCDALAAAIGISPNSLRPGQRIVLEGPPTVDLQCRLGELQQTGGESFVPFTVRRLARSGTQRGI